MTKLTELCDIQYGFAFDSGAFTDDDSYPQLVRIRDVKRGYSETFYNGDYPEEYVLSAGDLLVGMDGEFNIAKWKVDGALLNQRVCKVVAKENTNEEYLRFALSKALKEIEDRTSFATVKHLSAKELNKLEIPFPSYDEQNKISEILQRLEIIIDSRKAELNTLDELIRARFVELFEDGEFPLKTVEEVCSDIVDCPHTTPKYDGELKNPAIRTSEIKKGYITWDSMRFVSDEEYEERISRLRPEAGDIVYGREGTFGNAAVLPSGYKFCLGQRVMLLRPDYTKCTSEYLLHAVISDDVYRQAVGKNNASTVAHVNVKDVKQFKIPLPSFDKQNQFAEFVKQVDKSKVAVQKSLDETQILFDSLMQEYFG